ncbi:ubiquitin carboxyl-terminal hydrolase [Verticillium alfalfae VaMs.102]|uniref:ubiquitinyl hydrolase 1 n=1 Tax=Verticillium alfalfae (strain VaMs.102 / ATCC MYA-4576 / FGSC 10136) TaxID=526221 RepID=C9S6J3_VERA1|nr:ubiquitin carboxyl-terminal hydrolase [Verticillium alfalfae VaMs.102]EEY14484.1 ubiquitin carboxyl-terminal hydrolase [Verticillium alfalfae VaMs.102]
MPGGGAPAVNGAGDMGPVPGHGAHIVHGGHGGHGGHGNSRRRPPPPPSYVPQYHQQHHQQHQHIPPMYPNYMNPYAGGQQFYQQLPPQYQNGGMPTAYMQHYQQPYMRSPPAMQQFVPMAGVSVPQPYPRQHQQSPALATPYQPPPMPSAIAPHTPTSTHSSHIMAEASALSSASPATSQIEQGRALAPAQEELVQPETAAPAPPVRQPTPEPAEPKEPFRAPLPWLSRPDLDFPKHTRVKRRKRAPLVSADKGVTLPSDGNGPLSESADHVCTDAAVTDESQVSAGTASTLSAASTPATPHANAASTSHTNSTETTTQNTRPVTSGSGASTSQSPAPSSSRPVVPVVPAIPKGSPKTTTTGAEASSEVTKEPAAQDAPSETPSADVPSEEKAQEPSEEARKSTPRAPPSSWSALFAKNAAAAAAAKNRNAQNGAAGQGINGTSPDDVDRPFDSTFPSDNSVNTIAAALRAYRVRNPEKVKYVEPRGLVNIGNMCYMNSRKGPFEFQEPNTHPGRNYGTSFTPEFIYQAIEPDKRFENMRRGHQQDAEEFFGLLLQSLDDECAKVMGVASGNAPHPAPASANADATADGWLEVGAKQRAAVTRSSGASSSTPITQIFGGLLRSELRVTGKQDSITTEPYQALQLDIGANDVRNVVDALKRLTAHEKLEGSGFNSPHGKNATVVKQTLIDTLPPVLILHLKRFHFDAEGGTTKIWKKVGYPLELEIPVQALARQWRASNKGGEGPKYKLIAVVYHHGKHANGGHYTADVRRQDEHEWIRLDDTVIRRVRSEDVAEVGEEEPAKATTQASGSRDVSTNRFGAMNDDDAGDRGEWTSVDKTNGNKNRWSAVANGAASQSRGKQVKESVKDNKVAYLLFYQRV